MRITEVVDMNKNRLNNSTNQANGSEKRAANIQISLDSTIIIQMIARNDRSSIKRSRHIDIDNIMKSIEGLGKHI